LIDRVQVSNFQSVAAADVEFAPFTAVLGESDQGKSALLRAIAALLNNRAGTDFVTHGHSQASVEVVVDGHTVEWDKGKDVNRYLLDGALYDKVGRGVPDEVVGVFDLHPASVAGQFDRPFLLFDSGAEVSQVIGDLTNIALLYEAVRVANVEAKSLSAESKALGVQLSEAVGAEEKLSPQVTALGSVVDVLQATNTLYQEQVAQAATVSAALAEQARLEGSLGRFEGAAKLAVLCEHLVSAQQGVDDDTIMLGALTGLLAKLEYLKKQQRKVSVKLPQAAVLDEYAQLVSTCAALSGKLAFFAQLWQDHTGASEKVAAGERSVAGERAALADLLEGLDACPFSGGEFYAACKERLS
jgi:energy-coupling factor transporter ATP-binding protein EcfA2